MDGNKDESDRCIELALKALSLGKLETAQKLIAKAEAMYPSQRAKGNFN